MSRKEKDLQKVIEEIKTSLQQKDLDYLNNTVLPKVDENTNFADLLKDKKIQDSIQKVMQNPNLAALLSDPNLKTQITNLMSGQSKGQMIEELKKAFSTDSEKKKIDSFAILQQLNGGSAVQQKDENVQKMQLLEVLKPYLKSPQQEKIFQTISDFYRYKNLIDALKQNNLGKTPAQPEETDEEQK